jgi:O-succinylbenzoic acid--CoA ligase
VSACPVRAAAERAPEAPALIWKSETWSYEVLDALVDQATAALRRQGVTAGARVPVRSPSSPEVVVLFHALGRLGAVFLAFNTRLTEAEVAQCLAQVPPTPAAAGVRAALFTSGTTGVPRLIELTEQHLQASAAASAKNLGGEPTQRWLGTLPLFHVGGLAMLHRCAVYGACLQLEPGFDAERASQAFDDGVTHASLVPTTLERLLDVRGARAFRGVKAVLIGGGPMTSSLLSRARAAGLPVLQTYGLTEACSQVTTERLGEADGTTAGPALEGVEVQIVDEHGAVVAAGWPGFIEVRGPTVTVPGWLATKDLGVLDELGRLTVLSRRVDLIISGGENVYPLEVEAAMRELPAVADVCVVPRPDLRWGQVPVAFVVERTPVSDQALTDFARARLASFKVPKMWKRLKELPRNAMGKLDRRALVDAID